VTLVSDHSDGSELSTSAQDIRRSVSVRQASRRDPHADLAPYLWQFVPGAEDKIKHMEYAIYKGMDVAELRLVLARTFWQ